MTERVYRKQVNPFEEIERNIEWLKQEILVEKEPEKKIARIIFNRPDRLNALTHSHYKYIEKLVTELEWDDDLPYLEKGEGILTFFIEESFK